MTEAIKEMGDNPNLYAIASDPSLPSTWKFPLFDAMQVDSAIRAITYGDSQFSPKLTDAQRTEAFKRIMDRIPQLQIEDWAKNSMMDTVKWHMKPKDEMVMKEYEDVPDEVVRIMTESQPEFTTISELSLPDPKVPLAADIDVAKLTEGDADPMFVTLKIAEIGAVSTNKLVYDRPLVETIAEQINSKKVGGIFGHIKDEDRNTAFPIPKAIWVGAKLHGNSLYAKSYIMAGEQRDYLRKVSAVNGKIGTSIYGKGKQVPSGSNYRILNFSLEQVDYAPADRASLKLNSGLKITSELENKEIEMSFDITSLRAENAKDLPADVKAAVIAEYTAEGQEMDRIKELEFTVQDKDKLISELEGVVSEYKQREFGAELDRLVNDTLNWNTPDEASKSKLDGLRKTLRSLTVAELAGAVDAKKAERAIKTVWDREFGIIAESVKDAITGGAAVTGGAKVEDWRDAYVKNAADIRKEFGV